MKNTGICFARSLIFISILSNPHSVLPLHFERLSNPVKPCFAAELAASMEASRFSIESILCCTHTFEEMGCIQANQKKKVLP